jgi:purple acid phosphatase-like protein
VTDSDGRPEPLARRYGRRDVLSGAVALGVAAPVLLTGRNAAAATQLIGPRWVALGESPTTQMYVSWSTPSVLGRVAKPTAPQIRWGLSSSYGSLQAADRSAPVPLPTGVTDEPPEKTVYNTVLLTSLLPGTTYHYALSNDGVVWSSDRTFTTAVAGPSDFRFTAFGDQGVNTLTAGRMVLLVASLKPALHVLPGDLAYATPSGLKLPDVSGFHPGRWNNYLTINGEAGSHSIPWMASVGAHEVEPLGDHGYAGFVTRIPQHTAKSSGSPVVHAYKYGNVAFIHLDGNDVSAQETVNNGYTKGAQTTWLKRTLGHYRATGSAVDFIVVVVCCCCYSTNRIHGSDGGLRTVWGPLFDTYKVDLVISGHVHAYERTYPMRAGQPTRRVASGGTVHPATDGTTYICVGGGGKELYTTWYGTTGGGDRGSSTAPKIWEWSGGETASGGRGTSIHVTDTAKHFSAYRRAAYCCLVVDVTAPSGPHNRTTLHVRALEPAQTPNAVTSIVSPKVMDSVTLVRTS